MGTLPRHTGVWQAHLIRLYQQSFRWGFERLEYPPLDVAVELNQTCNLRCAMCARAAQGSQEAAPAIYQDMNLSGQMDRSILDAMTPWIGSAVAVRAYGFGEPLLSPLFETLVDRAKRAGAHVDFFTNGQLLSEHWCTFLVRMGVNHVTLSCSGAEQDTYARIHGGASLDKLMRAAQTLQSIKKSKGSRLPSVSVNVVLQRENQDQILSFVRLAQEASASSLNFKPLMVYGADMEPLSIPWEDPKVQAALQEAQEKGLAQGIEVSWPKSDIAAGPQGPACFLPWRSVYVGWNGKVRSDCFGGPALGDLHQESPEEIWNGQKARSFRRAMAFNQWPASCHFCLERRLRPLQDEIPDLFTSNFRCRPPEPLPELLGRRTPPGALRMLLRRAPAWSTWTQQSEWGLSLHNSGDPLQAHLVCSIYPENSPEFPKRHHGYWTFWNLSVPTGEVPMVLRFFSPKATCEIHDTLLNAEGVRGEFDGPGTYIVELSLRQGDATPLIALKFRHVFLKDHQDLRASLDAAWPELRRRSPSWFEPDRVTLTHLAEKVSEFAVSQRGRKMRIVDVGCGEQPYRPYLEEIAERVVGVDGFPGSFVDVFSDGCLLDLPSASFDLALCTQVLEHVARPDLLIREIHRVLAPEGVLLLSSPLIWETHYVPTDFCRLTEESLRRFLSGFIIEDVQTCGSPTDTLWQARNLVSHRRRGGSLTNKLWMALRNMLLMHWAEKSWDPSFTPNFFIIARKP